MFHNRTANTSLNSVFKHTQNNLDRTTTLNEQNLSNTITFCKLKNVTEKPVTTQTIVSTKHSTFTTAH